MGAGLFIFDLDGTLVDSYPQIYQAFAIALGGVGEPVPGTSVLAQFVGTSMSRTIERLFPHWSASKKSRFRASFGTVYSDVFRESKPFPGAQEMLLACADRYVIVTNKDERWARPLVEALGGQELSLICPVERVDRKPSPVMIRQAKSLLIERHGVAHLVSIGDTPSDQEASRAADVEFIGVGWTPHDLGAATLIENWGSFEKHIRQSSHGG